MNTVIEGMSGGDPFEIILTCLEDDAECTTALLTVRQKDTDLGISDLEKLSKACLAAVKILKKHEKANK